MVTALSAVFDRELQPQKAELPTPGEQVERELPGLFPLVDPWRDFVLDEPPDRFPELGVVLGEGGAGR